jgi:hypothetical protein
VNLTVKLQQISHQDLGGAFCPTFLQRPLLVCDRCHDVEEIVVVVMEIIPLEGSWALCGSCASELPVRFRVA